MPEHDYTPVPFPNSKNFIDLTGQRFGRLVVVAYLGRRSNGLWMTFCDCGNKSAVESGDLKRGHTTSCGCWKSECRRTHGKCHTPEHYIWSTMIQRCENVKDKSYARYGGRGIRVCERWRRSFADFLTDMGQRPALPNTPAGRATVSIDRIDNNAGYFPENCRWTTSPENSRNTRQNVIFEFNGQSNCIAAWADKFSIKYSTLLERLRRGWSIERALTEPVKPWRK